jgi:uncharacterized protein
MDVGFSAWLFIIAVATSALGGALGMASGIFIVPVLVTFGGVGIRTAVAASIVSVVACSCGSAAAFLRAGLTNIRVAIVLETATTLGALTGVFIGGLLPASFLFLLLAFILLLSARQMLARRRESVQVTGPEQVDSSDWATILRLHSSYPDVTLGRDVSYRVHRVPLGLGLMYGAGLISALLGIGSGVLKIPAMDSALRLPIKVSSATSNFMIGVTAAASGVAYFALGEIHPDVAGPVAVGSVIGALLGARLLMTMSGDRLRLAFVAVLILLAAQMLLEAFGIHLGRHAP